MKKMNITRMNTPRKNKSIIGLGILFAGLACLTACGPSNEQKEDQKETVKQEGAIDTPSVQLVDVKKGIITGSITIPGELTPYLEANLYAKIASYVKTLLVDIGSQVQKGQLLAQLEAPEINSQLAEAKSRAPYRRTTWNRRLPNCKPTRRMWKRPALSTKL
jgi:membrane fusion protein (multidrug efflux system)